MKIFFNASLSGKDKFGKHYQLLHDAVAKTGHKIIAAPILTKADDLDWTDPKEAGRYYQELEKWTHKCDIAVFEVSYPSTSIGFEIALTLQMSKPVVAFHVKDAPQNLVLDSINDERFQMVDYDLAKLDRVVKSSIEYASENMDTRFNFFISPTIGSYLDWIAKVKKVPRAVFLRQLIEQDMKKQGFEG